MKRVLIAFFAIVFLFGCQKQAEPEPIEQKELTLEEKIDIQVQQTLAAMTLSEKIYQLFIVAPEQLGNFHGVQNCDEQLAQALTSQPVGGLILFASNIDTPEQTTQMIKDFQANSALSLFIAVDEEGGVVRRIGNNPNFEMTNIANMRDYTTMEEVYQATYTIGNEIRQYGFNVDFAPVADTLTTNSSLLYYRSFGSDTFTVSSFVKAAVLGFKDAGMICSLKHFPNHGATTSDSHLGSAVSYSDLDTLNNTDLIPFIEGISVGADMVMVGHISLPNITGNYLPASLSKEIITDLLRDQIGFDGIIITDSCRMQAVTSQVDSSQVGVKILQAGADIILMPDSLADAYEGIYKAVIDGTLSESRIDESVSRILKLKISKGIIQLNS